MYHIFIHVPIKRWSLILKFDFPNVSQLETYDFLIDSIYDPSHHWRSYRKWIFLLSPTLKVKESKAQRVKLRQAKRKIYRIWSGRVDSHSRAQWKPLSCWVKNAKVINNIFEEFLTQKEYCFYMKSLQTRMAK